MQFCETAVGVSWDSIETEETVKSCRFLWLMPRIQGPEASYILDCLDAKRFQGGRPENICSL